MGVGSFCQPQHYWHQKQKIRGSYYLSCNKVSSYVNSRKVRRPSKMIIYNNYNKRFTFKSKELEKLICFLLTREVKEEKKENYVMGHGNMSNIDIMYHMMLIAKTQNQ